MNICHICPNFSLKCFKTRNDTIDVNIDTNNDTTNDIIDVNINTANDTIDVKSNCLKKPKLCCSPRNILDIHNNDLSQYTIKKYKTNYEQYFITYFYCNHETLQKKKIVIIFDHYGQENIKLPIKGWFHKCLYCMAITGNTFFINQKKYTDTDVYIHLCRNCTYRIHSKNLNIHKDLLLDINKVLDNWDKKTLYI